MVTGQLSWLKRTVWQAALPFEHPPRSSLTAELPEWLPAQHAGQAWLVAADLAAFPVAVLAEHQSAAASSSDYESTGNDASCLTM